MAIINTICEISTQSDKKRDSQSRDNNFESRDRIEYDRMIALVMQMRAQYLDLEGTFDY